MSRNVPLLTANKKYLDSLLVTKEGNILLHGTITPDKENLARKIKLVDDDTDEQRTEKRVLHFLNRTAEEQPPNIRLHHVPDCNRGCSNCCSRQLPPFPSLPNGFVKNLVSLSDYFSHFHKSTAANILATGAALANLANHLSQPWQWPSERKLELRKGAGVWIDAAVLRQLVKLAEFGANRKPPHQALVKSLLTHLIGMEKYLETSAEKMDRRLISAVVAFTNEKYPEMAQPVERFYRCINLNRGYLIKKRNDGSQNNNTNRDGVPPPRKESLNRPKRLSSVEIDNLISVSNSKKVRVSGGSASEQLQASSSSTSNSDKNIGATPFNDFTNKKIVVVQRGTNPANGSNLQSNSEQILSSVLNSVHNPQSAPTLKTQPHLIKTSGTGSTPQPYILKTSGTGSTTQPYILKTSGTGSTTQPYILKTNGPQPYIIRTSSASSNSQPYIIKTNTTSSNSQPYVIKTNTTSSNSQPYIIKTNTTSSNSQPYIIKTNTTSSNSQPYIIKTNTTSTNSQPYLVKTSTSGSNSQPYILKTSTTNSNSPILMKTNATSSHSQSVIKTGQASLQSLMKSSSVQSSNSSNIPQRVVLSGLTTKPFKSANLQNTPPQGTNSNPIVISDHGISSGPPVSQGVLNTANVNSKSLITSMSQLGSFRYSAPTAQARVEPDGDIAVPIEVKIEKKCSYIEGALDLDF
ncbi:serine-rich adhesin for platelets-like isoform X2 [Frankliniella occidentalis]|uniref:Serine-rich adhesin for platelets-like isoform X2 n=1 Tax=Frankliniella occidentalis TaxID=133901 RepID=A0A9C6WY80_FRAOC|nr:serine-rich adhesin for platelets-like isoform X2 [Frankliniella occidentalis]